MRPKPAPSVRHRRDNGADNVKMAQHGGSKNVHAGAVLEQMQRDIAAPHVCGGTQSGLPVAGTPVPCGIEQRGLLRQQVANAGEIGVRIVDELTHQVRLKLRLVRHGG